MPYLSVVIITYNEEKNIERCIRSVKKIADEIIVLDSYSTDRTAEIASQNGAIIYKEKFRGYIEQKNLAAELATYDLVLSLDADEAIDDKLAESILKAKEENGYRLYSMNRCTNYCGKFIRHGIWYPDRKLRIFDRRIAQWGGINPHDKIERNIEIPVKHLAGDILHYSYNSIDEHILQNSELSSIAANSYYKLGKKASWLRLIISPSWAFFNGYFLRLGFLDGRKGWIIACKTFNYTFQKYKKLQQLRKSSGFTETYVNKERVLYMDQKYASEKAG